VKKRQPGEIRIQKELDELELPQQCKIAFPDPNVLMKFHITITPDESYWKGASYTFCFTVPGMYPHEAPKVKSETKIYHPNIDLQGNVCLNILREDWKPVLSISSVVYGLLYLFLEPNPNDPLNHEAAQVLRQNAGEFGRVVARTLRGGSVGNESFPRLL
jgi:ubiquitin-conjugating enzyme E2 M